MSIFTQTNGTVQTSIRPAVPDALPTQQTIQPKEAPKMTTQTASNISLNDLGDDDDTQVRLNVPNKFQNPMKARIRMLNASGGYYDLSIPTFEDSEEARMNIKQAAAHIRAAVGRMEEGGNYCFLKFLAPGQTLDQNGTVVQMTRRNLEGSDLYQNQGPVQRFNQGYNRRNFRR